jgi:hypothetical protein
MSATVEPGPEKPQKTQPDAVVVEHKTDALMTSMQKATPFCVEACHVIYDVYLEMFSRESPDVSREQLLKQASVIGLQNLTTVFFNERYHAYFQHTDEQLKKDVGEMMQDGPFRCVSCLLKTLWLRCKTVIRLSHKDITTSPESNLRKLLEEWDQGFLAMLLCLGQDEKNTASSCTKGCTGVDQYDPEKDLLLFSKKPHKSTGSEVTVANSGVNE